MILSDLKPNPGNPRRITDEKLRMLEKSMTHFGDLSGIWFNKQTGRLGGGHQRSKVIPQGSEIVITHECQRTESGTIGYGYVEYKGERFHVTLKDWDEITEKAANLSSNESWGEWDEKLRNDWFLELDQHNVDFEVLGKSRIEVEDLLTRNRFEIPEIAPKDDPKDKESNMMTCPNCNVIIEKA